MKLLLLLFCLAATSLSAQTVVLRDNGIPRGYYSQVALAGYEESVILRPAGPCKITKVQMYLGGSTTASRDTFWIVGDPAEGTIAPTQFVWKYNALANAVVNYTGTPGWYTIDVSSLNIHSDGYDRICIQHTNDLNGPRFATDSDSLSVPFSSYLYNPQRINGQNYPGVYSLTSGDFMVRLEVEYDFPEGHDSAKPPYPSLLDITQQAKLVSNTGNPLKSARVSIADWNNDGFDDVFTGGEFFENKRDGTFKNVSGRIDISASAVVWGDMDNDGWLDAYAVDPDGDKIFKNNGNGTFTDITAQTQFSNVMPTVTPIWLDYNRDGNLDIFIANGKRNVGGTSANFPDQLWKNNGNGTFTNVTFHSAIDLGEPAPLDCWGASAADYNNDGWVDIFVATHGRAPDKLFKNNGNGTFTEFGAQTGARGVATADARFFGDGVGCDWGDYNNDGFLDLVVGNFGNSDWMGSVSNPSLVFKNNGGENFTEVSRDIGIKFFENTSGVMWADLDLDGNLDLWHSQYADNPAGNSGPERLSRVYINGGAENNYAFTDKTWELGAKIHGAWTQARLDFDNDGDIDVIAASPHDGVRLLRNDMERKGNWIGFRFDRSVTNRVLGTISVYAGSKVLKKEFLGSGSGASATQSTSSIIFGLGSQEAVDSIVVSQFGERKKILLSGMNRYFSVANMFSILHNMVSYATPALQMPRNSAKLNGTNVLLKWTKSLYGHPNEREGIRYQIQIAKGNTIGELVLDTIMSDQSTALMSSLLVPLAPHQQYSWRVSQFEVSGTSSAPNKISERSSIWSFTTGEPTSVENESSQEDYPLKGASPNPVSSQTTISFFIEKAGELSLKLFDLHGNEIATLAKGQYEPGSYSVQWDASGLAAGIYYYTLQTVSGNISKKLVVGK
ncbi:MAG TPA: T9SS type A sorting domain-containing protein [Patescibacteria group bacterium]|nr:T9SS type A sorting domain-containing protein [Patescibacteria group bacterium]